MPFEATYATNARVAGCIYGNINPPSLRRCQGWHHFYASFWNLHNSQSKSFNKVQHLVLQIRHLKVTQEETVKVCVISELITAMTYFYTWGNALMYNWAILKSKKWIVLGCTLKVETGQRFIFCLEEKTSRSWPRYNRVASELMSRVGGAWAG